MGMGLDGPKRYKIKIQYNIWVFEQDFKNLPEK